MAVQLVPLPDIERLSPACIRILGDNPGKFSLQGTNTYLVGTGASRLLIDTGDGRPAWKERIEKVLEEEKASVASAIVTHWHHDHQGGVRDLLELSPSTKIYKNQPGAGQVDITHGGTIDVLDIVDGQEFEVEGARLTAVHTPGHAVDHMVLISQEEDAMFTGDNVLGQGTAVFEDLKTYLRSLEKMKTLFQGRAYPGHGPVIADGPAKITEYILHRQQREDQVVQTLSSKRTSASGDASDSWTPMELVKVIYADVPEGLHLAAAGGVVQILHKLEQEGKVVGNNEDRWRLNSRATL